MNNSNTLKGKKAALYVRVSTTEQAERGFSLREQQAQLERYCDITGVEPMKVFVEDHSAKTFERPQWKSLEKYLQGHKDITLVLVVKWDRFSRNTGDSYAMLRKLEKVGVIVQAIQQPLDMNVPESKLMLALYLSAPEVENDRRSLNTLMGMRRARREGRWVGTPLLGYSLTGDRKHRTMQPNDQAPLVIRAFEDVASGIPMADVHRSLRREGLKVNFSTFHRMIANRAYTGVSIIPRFRDEPEEEVRGLHEALVSRELWEKAQAMRAKRQQTKHRQRKARIEVPLRNFVLCPICGHKMTGSPSRSKTNAQYWYYHCQRGCSRFRADLMNEAFMSYLSSFKSSASIIHAFRLMLDDAHRTSLSSRARRLEQMRLELAGAEDRLSDMMSNCLERGYTKADCDQATRKTRERIEQLKDEIKTFESTMIDKSEYVELGLRMLEQPDYYFQRASVEIQRKWLSSMFGPSLLFDGENYRTQGDSIPAFDILSKIKELQPHKRKKPLESSDLSRMVTPTGFEPVLPP